ncbi:MAG: Wzz/FepE/Etk N-terminal domain-containing protein [Bacilli bacterium]
MEENQNVESGISLVDLFTMLFHNIFIIVIITAFVTALGTIYTLRLVEPMYQSQTDVMVQVDKTGGGGSSSTDIDVTLTLRLIQTVSEFLEKDIILDEVVLNQEVIDAAGRMSVKEVRSNLDVSYNTNSLLLRITYKHEDPKAASVILNEIVDTAIEIANEDYPVLVNTIYKVGVPKDGVYVSPNKTLNILISIILGGILGVGASLVIEFLKTTVRNKKDIENLLPKYQLIGLIPEIEPQEGETDV